MSGQRKAGRDTSLRPSRVPLDLVPTSSNSVSFLLIPGFFALFWTLVLAYVN